MIQNRGKKMKSGILFVIFLGFIAAVYGLAQNRAAITDYLGLFIFYVLLMISSALGMTLGLIWSLLGVLAYGAHHFYDTIVRQIPADISSKDVGWIIGFPLAALGGGYLGDHLIFVSKFFKKYMRQIESLLMSGQLGMMGNEVTFQQGLREECSRSRRSLAHFSLILIDIGNLQDLERTLGADAPMLAAEKLSEQICRNTRDIDRKGKLDDTRFGIILPDSTRENSNRVFERIAKSMLAVEMEYRGRMIKSPIQIIYGAATFPENGDNAEQLIVSAQTAFDGRYPEKSKGENKPAQHEQVSTKQP